MKNGFDYERIKKDIIKHIHNQEFTNTKKDILKYLKENDKNCSIEFLSNTSTTHNTNSWVGTANILGTKNVVKAILKYKGKEFQLGGASDSSGFMGSSAKIVINESYNE